MDGTLSGQVNRSAAEIYEDFFLPALFQEWAPRVADAADIRTGQSVLDVACGTGVLLRACAERIKPGGRATGLDRNDGMLTVAKRKYPEASWRIGMAEALPFDDASFDRVVSQFGLMFFEDRVQALNEMWRALRPGGRLVVAVWAGLADTPGYAAMTALLRRLFGNEIARELESPFVLGNRNELLALFEASDVPEVTIETLEGTARFRSIEDWVHTDVKGWTLADLINDAEYTTLLQTAERELQSFVIPDGTVRFAAPAHLVTARKH